MNVYLKSHHSLLWTRKIYLLRQQAPQCAHSALRFPCATTLCGYLSPENHSQ
jgi:hypothetical protein